MAAKKQNKDVVIFNLRLPAHLHRQLRHYAVNREQSLNSILVEIVEKWWAQNPERQKFSRL